MLASDHLHQLVSFRTLVPSDAPQAAALFREVLPEDPAAMLGLEFLERSLLPQLIQKTDAGVAAISSGRIVGFVTFGDSVKMFSVVDLRTFRTAVVRPAIWRKAIEVFFLLSKYPDDLPQCELQWIVVSGQHQHSGIGTQLVKSGLSQLATQGIKTVWVKTLESSTTAIAFYEQLGFREIHRAAGRVFLVTTTVSPSGAKRLESSDDS